MLVLLLTAQASAVVWAQATWPLPAGNTSVRSFPASEPIAIEPRVFLAYAALTAAALLTLLYLFRGRAFITYWIGSWVLLAAALGIVARDHGETLLGRGLTGVAILCVVWSAGLLVLAARAFPLHSLNRTTTAKWAAGSAAGSLIAALALPFVAAVSAGALATGALLGWGGVHYVRIGRRNRYAGAFLVGGCVCIAAAVNAGVGGALLLGLAEGGGRLTVFNAVNAVFIALGMHLLVFEDMTQELRLINRDLAAAHEEVKRLAITDPLTGCHNRRFFDEIERRELQRHRRYASPMAVMFVDVNHFKRLNDSQGHDRGDDVLRVIGLLLRRHVRESDYVIRWGGDEFLLMLTCTETEAHSKAEELKLAFRRERAAAGVPEYVGLSVGVAAVSRGADSLREAIRYADSRMYRDKLTLRAPAAV